MKGGIAKQWEDYWYCEKFEVSSAPQRQRRWGCLLTAAPLVGTNGPFPNSRRTVSFCGWGYSFMGLGPEKNEEPEIPVVVDFLFLFRSLKVNKNNFNRPVRKIFAFWLLANARVDYYFIEQLVWTEIMENVGKLRLFLTKARFEGSTIIPRQDRVYYGTRW